MFMLQASSMIFRVQCGQLTLVSLEPLGDAVLQCELSRLSTKWGDSAQLQETNLVLLDFVTEFAIARKHQLKCFGEMNS